MVDDKERVISMDEILSVMKMVDAVVVGCRCCIGMANGVGYS